MKRKIYAGSTAKTKSGNENIEIVGPIRFGDIIKDANMNLEVVGIADGVFMQDSSVWPKEIIHAINNGMMVFGSSSMGALRAVELERYGMVGVGKIYEVYRTGEIDGDDEVAILHDQQDENELVNTSIPLVNLRLIQKKIEKDSDKKIIDKIIRKAKRMPFWERELELLKTLAVELGATEQVINEINESRSRRSNDYKYKDFLEMKNLIEKIQVDQIRQFWRLYKVSRLFQLSWEKKKITELNKRMGNKKIEKAFDYMNEGIFATGTGIWRYVNGYEANSQKKLQGAECIEALIMILDQEYKEHYKQKAENANDRREGVKL